MMSTLSIEPVAVPLWQDSTGALRAGESRVLLDLVIHAFWKGATPESIVQSFDTLKLQDVYVVLAYHLANREDVDAYLARRGEEAETVRRRIEAAQPPRPNLKERLLKRSRAGEEPSAPAAH